MPKTLEVLTAIEFRELREENEKVMEKWKGCESSIVYREKVYLDTIEYLLCTGRLC